MPRATPNPVRTRLTTAAIKAFKRPATGVDFLWDELVSGFGVRFTPLTAAYVVQYRDSSGKKPRITIGRWPQMSPEDARTQARSVLAEALGRADLGTDVPLSLAIRTWYERERGRDRWRPRYQAKLGAMLSTYVEGVANPRVKLTPAAAAAIKNLGALAVGSVKRTDVLRVADHIAPGTAEQFLAMLSSFYNDLYERDLPVVNPARNRLRVTGGRRKRNRRLTDAEFRILWNAFQADEQPAGDAFALLAYTGARRREVTRMRWSELDLEAGTWSLPAERRKNGKHAPEPFVLQLHPAAVAILERQPRLEGSPYVWWGRRDGAAYEFHHALMDRIHAAVDKQVADWRLHDLRRYMRTTLPQLGVSQMVAELCLNHITARGGLVGVYDQHDYIGEMADAWQKWGDYLQTVTTQPLSAKAPRSRAGAVSAAAGTPVH